MSMLASSVLLPTSGSVWPGPYQRGCVCVGGRYTLCKNSFGMSTNFSISMGKFVPFYCCKVGAFITFIVKVKSFALKRFLGAPLGSVLLPNRYVSFLPNHAVFIQLDVAIMSTMSAELCCITLNVYQRTLMLPLATPMF